MLKIAFNSNNANRNERRNRNRDNGFTLIEAIIYVALFAVIIGGGVATAYYLISGAATTRNQALVEAEANFVLRKVDHLLTNARPSDISGGGAALTIGSIKIMGCGNSVVSADPSASCSHSSVVLLTSDKVSIGPFFVNNTSATPPNVEFTLTSGDRVWETIKYFR